MEQIIEAFGINWKLLIVNTINFGLLLLALTYFLYKPLTRILEERRRKVAQGVLDAEEAKKRLEEVERQRVETLASAGKEADEVLSKARKAGGEKERELVAHGEAAAARILAEAQAQAEEAKRQAIQESKEEVAKLVVLGIDKTLMHHK